VCVISTTEPNDRFSRNIVGTLCHWGSSNLVLLAVGGGGDSSNNNNMDARTFEVETTLAPLNKVSRNDV